MRRGRHAEVGAQLLVDVLQAARHRPHVRLDRERQARPDAPGVGYGSCPTMSTFTSASGVGEGAQHVAPGGQVRAPRRDLGPQELAHRGDLRRDRGQGLGPARVDQFG